MCVALNWYQACVLFGHPLEDTTATVKHELCAEAKSTGNMGDCNGASMMNVPEFISPYCTECNALECMLQSKVRTILTSNMGAGGFETAVLTEDFMCEMQGLPIDLSRAPIISLEQMLEFLRQLSSRHMADIDIARAELWVKAESRNTTSKIGTPDGMDEQFARWFVAAFQLRIIEAAMAIAQSEGDESRMILLAPLEIQAQVARTYRARLEYLGMFGLFLSFTGIGEAIAPEPAVDEELDSVNESEHPEPKKKV
ncbi:hypothetical protein BJ170DRAFT_597283 [Xylariales sp. AK1849]|nr:hypothetical protein BJ170DRAFT_597283 [Xylariales sp. AK1849]